MSDDGEIHETEREARLHARKLRWFDFCEEIGLTNVDAGSVWDNRLAAINILGIVVEEN